MFWTTIDEQVPQLLNAETTEIGEQGQDRERTCKAAKEVGATVKTSRPGWSGMDRFPTSVRLRRQSELLDMAVAQSAGLSITERNGVVPSWSINRKPTADEIAKNFDQSATSS